ncbi:MAG TPA: PDZ domain-containing protein, partial [Clostridia bacterium]|nr:PDZ domain-containing protein [Clostridia bacterium]
PDSFGFPAYTTRAQVYAVESGSAADRAGMKAGDVILALDGKDVYGASDLMATLYEYKIGDTVTITVLRDREQVDLTATLGERAG